MTERQLQAWSTPSWRIEPKYSSNVLIGNWLEERKKGLPYKHLIVHKEEPKHRNFVSAYDDHFNHHGHNPNLPLLRQWNVQKMAWLPEKSDFPIVEPPNNYGLFEKQLKRWSSSALDPMKSIYTVSYVRPTYSTPSLWNLMASSHSSL
ncbi:uncharacterized protein C1orf158 homolog isoform X2 [Ornithorhynchus anatinus]|uniref:Uncharacterized protein n=1 Tax=Ornithorhynchus anatinus TaxID=9258 RepID=A0A6I8N3A4_ORNAN|nr:uncharacterized protein C1orf158 homolog isoform X2 [Ornithorhynchus anatinus]